MKQDLISEIDKTIKEVVYSVHPLKVNFSTYLKSKLDYHYTYLANTYKKSQGHGIAREIMMAKIERAKIMLDSGYAPAEITFILHYSSFPHLSNQFKAITGITMTEYKQLIPATAETTV